MNFTINPADKFYPNHRVWEYCTFLGKFTDSQGREHDLGILLDESGNCDATVHSNKQGDYSSGDINEHVILHTTNECKKEVYRRAKILNLIQ